MQKFKETGDSRYIHQNQLAYKLLHDKASNITCDPQHNGYQRGFALVFYEFLVKKLKGSGGDVSDTATTILSQEFAHELHKPIIKNIQNCVKYVHLMNNIWGTNHTDIQLTSRQYKGMRFLLCVFDSYNKCLWVIPLKDKKGEAISEASQKIVKGSGHKLNKIWIDKRCEFKKNEIEVKR